MELPKDLEALLCAAIVRDAPISIWASKGRDGNHKIVFWNAGAEKIYQIPEEEAIDENYLELIISDEEKEESESDCEKVLQGVVYENFLATDIARDGSHRVMITNCFRARHPVSQEYLQIEMALDISDTELFSKEELKLRNMREVAIHRKHAREMLAHQVEKEDLVLRIKRLSEELREAAKSLSYLETSHEGIDDDTRVDVQRQIRRVARLLDE